MSLTNFKGDLSVGGTLSLSETGGILSNNTSMTPIVTIGTNEFNLDGGAYPLNWIGLLNESNDVIALCSYGSDKTESTSISGIQVSQGQLVSFSSTSNFSSVSQSNETGTALVIESVSTPSQFSMAASAYTTTTVGTAPTAITSSISVSPQTIQFQYSNSSIYSFGLDSSGVFANGPLTLDSGKITSDGGGNLGIANNLTLGWGSSLKIPNNDGSKTFTIANNGTDIVTNSGIVAGGNIKGDVVLTGAAGYTNGIVGGQGSMLGWNLISGDAYSYLVNIIPSSGYSASGFKFYTTVLGESISGTPVMQVDGSGNFTSKGSIQPSGQLRTSNGGHVEFYDSTGNNFVYVFQDSSVNRLRFYAGNSASGDVEFVNNLYGKNIILTGTSSLDGGQITTDGSGNITLQNNNYNTVPQYVQFDTHAADTNNVFVRLFWQHDDSTDFLGNTLTGNRFHFHNMKYGNEYEIHGTLYSGDIHNTAIYSTGTINCNALYSDGGKITTNGAGALTISNGTGNTLISTGEAHFGFNGFTDPDSGAGRDAKFGHSGIAVIGGTKTDTLTVTGASNIDGGKITTNGSGSITMYGSIFFPTSSNPYGSYVGINTSGNLVVGTQVAGGGGVIGINELGANSLDIINSSSLDNGAITTNGSGDIVVKSITTAKTGTIAFTSSTVSSGTSTSITVAMPKYGLYYITTTIYGVSTISGNVVIQKDSNMAVLYTSSTCQVITAGKSESYDGFGNLSTWTITTVTVETESSGTLQSTCKATDSGTGGNWTFNGTMDYELITTF